MKTSSKSLRFLNFIIDTIVLLAIMFLIFYGTYFIYPEIIDDNSILFDVFYFTIYFGYYLLFEALTGRTIGKILTKTVVVNRNGVKPNLLSLIVRTLIRIIPFDGVTFLFGNAGLHDLISKTTVISYKLHKETAPIADENTAHNKSIANSWAVRWSNRL